MRIIGYRLVGWVKLISDYAEITPQLWLQIDGKHTPICIVEWVVIRVSDDNGLMETIITALSEEALESKYITQAEMKVFGQHLEVAVMEIANRD